MTDFLAAQQPEMRLDTPSQYCVTGISPYHISAFFLHLLRDYFSDPAQMIAPHIRNAPEGGDYRWRGSGTGQGLQIELLHAWKFDNQEQRPAILIRDGDWDFAALGIGDQHMGGAGSDSHSRFSRFITGSNTIFCMAREPGDATLLAWEVAMHLMHNQSAIRKHFGLLRAGLAKVASVGKIKEATDTYGVPITFAFSGELSWTLRPESPILKAVELAHHTEVT